MSATQTVQTPGVQAPPPTSTNGQTIRRTRSSKTRQRAAAPTPAGQTAAPATAAAPGAAAKPPGARPSMIARPFQQLAEGMFQMLPNPDTPLTMEESVVWLQAVAATMRLAYKIQGTLTVTGSPAAA